MVAICRAVSNFEPASQGARPTSIESFTVGGGVGGIELGFSIAWVYDKGDLPWKLRIGLTEGAMNDEIEELRLLGFRPISISSRERAGISEYSAAFVSDGMPNSDWQVSLGLDENNIEGEAQARWTAGFYPFRGSAEQGSWDRFNMIWTRRPPGIAVQVRLQLTTDTFRVEDELRRTEGYHLESVARYEKNGFERHAAIWVKYQPCLRWTGTEFASDDPVYPGWMGS